MIIELATITLAFIFESNSLISFTDNVIYEMLPNPALTTIHSSFGAYIIYSNTDKCFYVSGPRTLEDTENGLSEVGAVYLCSKSSEQQCQVKFRMPNANIFNIQSRIFSPLFGFTTEENGDNLLICAPYLPYARVNIRYFCQNYAKSTGERIREQNIRIVTSNGSYYYIQNFGILNKKIDISDFIIGQFNFVYYNYNRTTELHDQISVEGFNDISKNIKLDSLLSYSLIYNENNNTFIYLILFYSMDNNMLGALGVFSDTLFIHQYLTVKFGSAKQYFGYSSSSGRFNNDQCLDFVVTAPYRSDKGDEGMAIVYYCIPNIMKYSEKVTYLLGENEPFAYFGISVSVIGDINRDGFDDLAILAPYWGVKEPHLFVYLSSESGFSGKYSQKLPIKSAGPLDSSISLGLLGKFSMNEDSVMDIAITFPSNNKVLVLSGVGYTIFSSNFESTFEQYRDGCFGVNGEKFCGTSYDYNCQFCISLDYLIQRQITNNLTVDYEITTNSDQTLFIENENLTRSYIGQFKIDKLENIHCFNLSILLLLKIGFLKNPLGISLFSKTSDAYYTTCGVSCAYPDSQKFSFEINTNFSSCRSKECMPVFLTFYSGSRYTLMSNRNNKIKYHLKNMLSNNITSHSIEINISLPPLTKVESYTFTNINDSMISVQIEDLGSLRTRYRYIIKNTLTKDKEFECSFVFLSTPPYDTNYLNFIFQINDPMYAHYISSPTEFKWVVENVYPIDFVGSSFPPEIILGRKFKSDSTSANNLLTYTLEFYNRGYLLLKNISINVKLNLYYGNNKILNLKSIEKPDDFVTKTTKEDKSTNSLLELTTESFKPESNYKFRINLEILDNINNLIIDDVKNIILYTTVSFESYGTVYPKSFETITTFTVWIESRKQLIIWPIIVACVIGVVILLIIAIIIYRFKLIDKLKHRAYPVATQRMEVL